MKKPICLILATVIILALSGCYFSEPNDSIRFYYLRNEFIYGVSDSVITAESREFSGNYDTAYLIKHYLNGPLDSSLKNPFPAKTSLIAFENTADLISITLSDQIAAQTGVSLTLTCVCLAKTVMELTGVETVRICAETLTLNSQDYLTFDSNTVLFVDNAINATVQPTE